MAQVEQAYSQEHSDVEFSKQHLTFFLAKEEYGIDILCVQEIKGWDKVNSIPGTPEYIRGIINLRGVIVPIIDLRIKFDLPEKECTPTTVVIIVKIAAQSSTGNELILGIVVDAVSDVYNVLIDEIKPAPHLGNAKNIEFVTGIATVNEKMIILIDINQLLNSEEITTLKEIRT